MASKVAEQALEIFDAVVQLSPPNREAQLEELCGSDLALREEVESLLAHDDPRWRGLSGYDHDAQPAWAPKLPLQFGRYRLIERIGEGGMGVVYRAEQEKPRRQVALKLMRPGAGSRSHASRFAREIEILAQLKHPGIAQIHDAGTVETPAGPQPYIAMELVKGRPLLKHAGEADLKLGQRLELWAAICETVEFAHQQGIIHRDLKPDNILVIDECGVRNAECGMRTHSSMTAAAHGSSLSSHHSSRASAQPKILDFGVAKLLGPSAASGSLATLPGQLIGTPSYMAPEQFEGEADTRSDVYALGVLGYELLTGFLPIDVRDTSILQAARCIRESTPLPLSHHDRRYRGELELIVAKALEKEKGRRYGSASALAEDIRRFLRHEPIEARKASAGYLLMKLVRRHRVLSGSVAALVAISLLYGAIVTVFYNRSVRAETVASERAEDAGRKFRMALDTLDSIVREVDEELEHVPGVAAVRMRLLRRALDQFESLSRDAPHDPAPRAELAQTLVRLSGLALRVGDTPRAEQLRREALAIREQLVAAFPDNPEYREAMAISKVHVGEITDHRGSHIEAGSLLLAAHQELERLASSFSYDPHYQELLSYSFERLSSWTGKRGDWAQSMDLAIKRQAIAQRLVELDPANLMYQYGLCFSHMQIAGYLVRDGQPHPALGHVRRGVELATRLVEAEPHNDQFAHQYILVQLMCPGVESRLESVSDCASRCVLARDAAERLLEVSPEDLRYQDLLAKCFDQEARLALINGDATQGTESLEKRLGLYERMLDSGADGYDFEEGRCRAIEIAIDTLRSALAEDAGRGSGLPSDGVSVLYGIIDRNLRWTWANIDHCCAVLDTWARFLEEQSETLEPQRTRHGL